MAHAAIRVGEGVLCQRSLTHLNLQKQNVMFPWLDMSLSENLNSLRLNITNLQRNNDEIRKEASAHTFQNSFHPKSEAALGRCGAREPCIPQWAEPWQ